MPYITASIIMQILGVVIPKLEEWQEQGAVGQRKITQWTRYVTIGIAARAVDRPQRTCSTRAVVVCARATPPVSTSCRHYNAAATSRSSCSR